MSAEEMGRRVLVTGASGYIGGKLVEVLARVLGEGAAGGEGAVVGQARDDGGRWIEAVVAADIRLPLEGVGGRGEVSGGVGGPEGVHRPGGTRRPGGVRKPGDVRPPGGVRPTGSVRRPRGVRRPGGVRRSGVSYEICDVRDAQRVSELVAEHKVDTVVHLASIVTPGKGSTRELEYQVDVDGTRNVLDACLAHGVGKLIVTSSGAAYGYHADNPEWLDEDDLIRGHEAFAYARHKRLVEEMLADARRDHPELKQLVFRPGTVLGEGVRNQITALFEKPVMLGIAGSASPFVFIWDEDVVACLVRGIREPVTGIYNLAGDGALTTAELARRMGKPYLPLPAGLVRGVLALLHPLGLSRYGPEQVDFLRYRPVLSNRRLKEDFGYIPRKTSAEVFDLYRAGRG